MKPWRPTGCTMSRYAPAASDLSNDPLPVFYTYGVSDGRPDRLARPKRRLLEREETYVCELFCLTATTVVTHRHRQRPDDSRRVPPRNLRGGSGSHSHRAVA